jgi:hypothetical protein
MTTPTDYEQRKLFLDDLKLLEKDEYEEIFRILKRNNVAYSENSNGIFFDLSQLSTEVFTALETFMVLCKKQRMNETERTTEMDALRVETKN